MPTGTAPFDLGRVVIGPRYKLIYNVLWQLPYQPVDFHTTALWKELQQMHNAVAKELKAALQEWMILERDFVPLPVPPQ